MGQDPGATTSNGPGAGLNGLQWLLIGGTLRVFLRVFGVSLGLILVWVYSIRAL